MKTTIERNEGKPNEITFHCPCDSIWIMKITDTGKIKFNRGDYPDMCEDEFAQRVFRLLEDMEPSPLINKEEDSQDG